MCDPPPFDSFFSWRFSLLRVVCILLAYIDFGKEQIKCLTFIKFDFVYYFFLMSNQIIFWFNF